MQALAEALLEVDGRREDEAIEEWVWEILAAEAYPRIPQSSDIIEIGFIVPNSQMKTGLKANVVNERVGIKDHKKTRKRSKKFKYTSRFLVRG